MLPATINYYASIDDVKTQLCQTDDSIDSVVTAYLRAASRAIDDHCRRHFYVLTGNKIFAPKSSETTQMEIPDCLRIHALNVDTDDDFDYLDEVWAYGTDYVLSSEQAHYPSALPGRLIRVLSGGSYALNAGHRYRINADWGYGNGYESLPIEYANTLGTVINESSTSLSMSAGHLVEVGHTLYVEGEAMFVTATTTAGATVQRGVNGTTAATHTGHQVYIYRYPEMVRQCCIDMCVEGIFTRSDSASQVEVAAGQFQFSRFEEIMYRHLRMVEQYRVWRVA